MQKSSFPELIPTGITGLDDVLRGGLNAGKMHLFSGSPGTGKTTFALLFIAEGIRRGERCLCITLGGAGEDFVALAKTGGILLDPGLFSLYEVNVSEEILGGPEQRIFHSAESEPAGALKEMLAEIKRVKPKRLVIDSLSDLRLLAEDLVSYRRMVLGIRQAFDAQECTVLITNNVKVERSEMDLHLETVCSGVINLEQVVGDSILLLRFFDCRGSIRRAVSVVKKRRGRHESTIREMTLSGSGIAIGDPLVEMQGVLTGVPILET